MTSPKLRASVQTALVAILVDFSNDIRSTVALFALGTPTTIIALHFANLGYGTPEETYEALATAMGLTEPFTMPQAHQDQGVMK